MLIGIAAETDPRETRVAARPETVKKFIALGSGGRGPERRRARRWRDRR